MTSESRMIHQSITSCSLSCEMRREVVITTKQNALSGSTSQSISPTWSSLGGLRLTPFVRQDFQQLFAPVIEKIVDMLHSQAAAAREQCGQAIKVRNLDPVPLCLLIC